MSKPTDAAESAPETFDPTAQRTKMFGSLGLDAPASSPEPAIVTEPETDLSNPDPESSEDDKGKPKDKPATDGKPADTSKPKEKPEGEQDDEDQDDGLDLDEFDEQEEDDSDTPDESQEPFTAEELEKIEKDETHAIKTAKEQGRLRKVLQREKQSLEEQNVRQQTEIDELRGELDKLSLTKIDPTTHPDFVEAKRKTHSSIIAGIDDEIGLDAAEIFERQGWADELTAASKMIDATVAERRKIKEPLRLSIAKKLHLVAADTTALDPEIDTDAIQTADKVIAVMTRHTSQYDKLAEIYGDIQSKAENKNLEVGFKEYQNLTKPIRESILTIATMSDKDIEEDPTSLQAMAAKKIKKSPEAKSKFDMIARAVIEMTFGPEALSQEELDRHSKSGKDMTEFHKNRDRRVKDFREKRLPEIAAALVLWPEIKKALPEFLKNTKQDEARRDKKDVVRKTATKTAPIREQKQVVQSRDDLREKMRQSLNLKGF